MDTEKVKTIPFDVVDYLDSEEAIAAYLEVFENDPDERLRADALADVTRARARLAGA
jgi:DNA-binding phage protein